MNSQHQGDHFFNGNLACRTFTPPEGCIDSQAIKGNAGVEYTKLQQKIPVRHVQPSGVAVAAKTEVVHMAVAPGTIIHLRGVCEVAPTTTDTVTIDLKKGNASTAFATVLTTPLVFNSSSANRTIQSATIDDPDYVNGDQYQIVVTVSGTSAQGLLVLLNLAEAAQ